MGKFKGIYTNRRGETRYAGPRLFETAAEAQAYAEKYAATRGTNPRVLDCGGGSAAWNAAMGHGEGGQS